MTLLGPSAPGMAFMMKKKKYKFNVEITLEELVEVALVNEVVFAKIRLLDGGSFQAYSERHKVINHSIQWNQTFAFPCKMAANASTGVLDPCLIRISIRKEVKGGRSYSKLGFVDLNLAEYAGSGLISRRWLLEGYDQRHRLDNSMLRVSVKMHMVSGDILFKAPSPSLKSKQIPSQNDLETVVGAIPIIASSLQPPTAVVPTASSVIAGGVGSASNRPISSSRDEIITQSQASSGFGSLTKKKNDYLISDFDTNAIIGSGVTDSGMCDASSEQTTIASDSLQSYPPTSLTSLTNAQQVLPGGGSGGIGGVSSGGVSSSGVGSIATQVGVIEMGHSRNSSNTSQMSKGSGYSSFSHSQHSRQSSEGDSGHARFPKSYSLISRLNQRAFNAIKLHIPSLTNAKAAPLEIDESIYLTPDSSLLTPNISSEEYRTPPNETPAELLITPSTVGTDDSSLNDTFHTPRILKFKSLENLTIMEQHFKRASQELSKYSPRRTKEPNYQVTRIKSLNNLVIDIEIEEEIQLKNEFEKLRRDSIFKQSPPKINGKYIKNKIGNTKFLGNNDDTPVKEKYPIPRMKSLGTIPDVVAERVGYDPFLTPVIVRKQMVESDMATDSVDSENPVCQSNSSLESDEYDYQMIQNGVGYKYPNTDHLLKGQFDRGYRRSYIKSENGCVKSSTPMRQSDGLIYYTDGRARSTNYDVMRNPSSGSLVISETGSLDRMKTAVEKRKKGALDDAPTVSGRVEETRVNPDSLIDEILKDTKLDQLEESAETSGLQLYIARDGTASLGSHEVKSRVSAGAFKQVVMQNPR